MKPSTKPTFSARRLLLLLTVQLFAATLYMNTLGSPPVWDDPVVVFGQDILMDCGSLLKVLDPMNFLEVLLVKNSARPAWVASVILDTCLGGGNPLAYRLTSIFWHALGAGLVAALAWRLGAKPATGLIAGLLFAAHPTHTEAVNIISFRTDLLCLVFLLLALILYLEARIRAGWARGGAFAGSLACLGLALLSKETAVVFPLLVLAIEVFFPAPSRGPRKERRVFAAASVILILLFLIFRIPRSGYVMRSHEDAFSSARERVEVPFSQPRDHAYRPRKAKGKLEDPPWHRIYGDPRARFLTMSRISGAYLKTLVWPHPLQIEYAPAVIDSWFDPGVLASWAAWLLLFAAAWRLRKRAPLAGLGLVWIPVTLLPVSGIVAILNLRADRFLYFPSAGGCLAAAALITALIPKERWLKLSAAALIAALAAKTVTRNQDFRSDRALLESVLSADDSVPKAHFLLAAGHAAAGEYQAAETEFQKSLSSWPDFRMARLLFADFLLKRDRTADAVTVLSQSPSQDDPLIRHKLAQAFWSLGKIDRSIGHFQAALELDADFWPARLELGVLLMQEGRNRDAIDVLKQLRTGHPEGGLALYHRSLAHRRIGERTESEELERRLRRRNPSLAAGLRKQNPALIRRPADR